MASYISVPRDLTKVKSKVMFNLTKRQLICFGLGALMGVPTFFMVKSVASGSTAAMVMMIVMIVALVDNERVMVLENRRGNGQVGQVKVSVQKTKRCKQMQPMKRAANY